MEKEITNPSPSRKYFYIIPGLIILIFLSYFTVMSVLAPVKKRDNIYTGLSVKKDGDNKIDERIHTDSTYLKLLKEKLFLQSLVSMAGTDSIYMTVNLSDSTLNLEISGVAVHTVPVKKIKMSRILKEENELMIQYLLSKPLTIIKDYSSIQKEPLMIKMAPKDTSEYQPDIIPDTADYEPVNYIIEMDNGVVLYIYQDEELFPGNRMDQFIFDLRYRIRNTFVALKSVLNLKVPEYHPYIKLRIPRADAKIIYRAMPVKGQVAIYR